MKGTMVTGITVGVQGLSSVAGWGDHFALHLSTAWRIGLLLHNRNIFNEPLCLSTFPAGRQPEPTEQSLFRWRKATNTIG